MGNFKPIRKEILNKINYYYKMYNNYNNSYYNNNNNNNCKSLQKIKTKINSNAKTVIKIKALFRYSQHPPCTSNNKSMSSNCFNREIKKNKVIIVIVIKLVLILLITFFRDRPLTL